MNQTTTLQQMASREEKQGQFDSITNHYHKLFSQVLGLLNHSKTRKDLIKDILFLVKATTGFDSVGIRLKDGEDYPYYATIGFSKKFVKEERYLCTRDNNGDVLYDADGNPYLDCMCGCIIDGRIDHTLDFFTEGGSFWTNSSTELIASTTEEELQGRTRNRCNNEGYESVALIPIRYDNKNIGLLHLCDNRKNCFTPSLISCLEDFVSSIGIALKVQEQDRAVFEHKHCMDTIKSNEECFCNNPRVCCNFFQHSPVGFLEEDHSEIKKCLTDIKTNNLREYFSKHPEKIISLAQKVKVISVNKTALRMLNVKKKEALYNGRNSVFNKDSFDAFREKLIALSQGKTDFDFERIQLKLSGERRNIYLKIIIPPGYEKTLSRVFVYIIDISNLQNALEPLEKSEEKYRTIVETSQHALILADIQTGIIIDCNNKVEELLGISKDEIQGMHYSELHPEEAAEDYAMVFSNPAKDEVQVPKTVFTCSKRNKNIPVALRSRIIHLHGESYILVAMHELTDVQSTDKKALTSTQSKKHGAHSYAHKSILSQRECEVLKLIVEGKSTKQIAEQMFISDTTVGTHRMRIMQKLNMHKTAQLVKYALQSGIFD